MKYNFDEIIDRAHAKYSYSMKWNNTEQAARTYQSEEVPDDRLPFFVADMDFKCMPELIEAFKETADHGIFGYCMVPDEYYQAVCRWMNDRFGMNVEKGDIRIYRGAHAAIVAAIEKLTKPGDGIIVPRPTYYYNNDVTSVGRHYCGFQMKNDNGYYTFDWEKFEELCKEPQNTMVILQQPHNPTGRCWTVEEITKIGEICRKYNVIMLCDDVHMDLARRTTKVVPFMNVLGPEGIVMVTGLNKTFNTAGLAVTNLIVKDEALKEKIGMTRGGLTPFGITAGIVAYTQGDQWVDELNEYLDDCIDYVVDRFHKELPKIKVWKPEGTYILWLDCTDLGLTSEELDAKIAGEAHIGFSNGAGMETPEGTLFRRFCVTSPKSVLKEAMDRLVKVLK